MKCVLEYKKGDWMCGCEQLYSYLPEKPDKDIYTAITTFHRRFYPDEKIDAENYPWIKHRAVANLEEIKDNVQQHELTWHWRLLLPCLRDYRSEARNYSIVLCVSQIRQWQLVSCFSLQWPEEVDADQMPLTLRRVPKKLLRPLVFGRSHRITRWEVYASFYEPAVKERICKAVADAGNDSWRLAHVLGRYDSYFRIKDPVWTGSPPKCGLDIEHFIDLEPEQAPLEIDGVSATSVCHPYGGVSFPIFSADATKVAPPKELLFSSDNYCRAFEQVSAVINDPGARAVLVIAPPGSGKEDMCGIMHSCRRRTGRCATINLAGLDVEASAFQLFNLKDAARRLEDAPDGLRVGQDFKAELEDGALFRALGGTVIIDELDKADDKVRGMLLRLLENDEVRVPTTSLIAKIPKNLRPLFVFAGSKTRKEFLELAPIDFWSRLTHIIEMQHPLAVEDEAIRKRVAEDYLRMFWLKQVEECFQREVLLKKGDTLYEPLRERFVGWWKCLTSRAVGDFVAREIAETLCGSGQALPSVRTLRGTVTRCFNLIFTSLLYNKNGEAPLEEWRRKNKVADFEPASGLLDLVKMCEESTAPDNEFLVREIRALNEVRSLIRASTTIQV